MTRHTRPRVVLVGGHTGPGGWQVDTDAGAPRTTTFADLAALELEFQTAEEVASADDLGDQCKALARVAEAWRQISRGYQQGEVR